MNHLIAKYLASTEAKIVRRTMSDWELVGWTVLGCMFVAPFVGALMFVVSI